MTKVTELKCNCGQVGLRAEDRPILSAECLCADCQQAGDILETLPGAVPLLDDNRATGFVLFRKDRLRCTGGQALLRAHRLHPQSKTRRVIASCCNTPMFLEFTRGHWLSVYGALWPAGTLPALDLRTMTRDAPPNANLSEDVPNPKTHNFAFFARLLAAWVAMGFRTPKIDYVQGEIETPQ